MSAVKHAQGIDVAPPVHEAESPDATAVYDAEARVFYDAETGKVLADEAAWECATDVERARAHARLAAARHAEDLIAAGIGCRAAERTAGVAAGVKAQAVGRWRRKVAVLPEGARVAALLDARRGGRPRLIEGYMLEELEALVVSFGDHLTSLQALEILEARFDDPPSRSTVRRWLARIRREKAHALSAISNPDRHRSHRRPAGGNASANVAALNQIWELDSTLADVMCADGKRYAIVSCIDIWSRRARVLVVPTSRAAAIAALLRRCILEWGVPKQVRTDEGADYTSHHVVGVFDDLEIAHLRCAPFTPEAKPHVERFLGTLARNLFAMLPGFTGHDVAQAQALRSRKSYAARQGEDDVKLFRVRLTVEELQAYCDDWCVTVYEQRGHAGLDGMSPYNRANAWAEPVRKVHNVRALDTLLAEPAGGGRRTVNKKGIRLENVDYIAGPLGGIVCERVHIRRDAADPWRIFVYRENAADPERPGEFICVAEDPAGTGADQAAIAMQMVAEWKAANRRARKWARDLAKRHRPERAIDDMLEHAKQKAGRVIALPRKGEAHETPALKQAARAAEAAKAADAEAGPIAPRLRSARARVAAANRRFIEEDEEWLK